MAQDGGNWSSKKNQCSFQKQDLTVEVPVHAHKNLGIRESPKLAEPFGGTESIVGRFWGWNHLESTFPLDGIC